MFSFEVLLKISRGALMGQQQHVGIIIELRQVFHILCVYISHIIVRGQLYLSCLPKF
jgi:hypothetical protein